MRDYIDRQKVIMELVRMTVTFDAGKQDEANHNKFFYLEWRQDEDVMSGMDALTKGCETNLNTLQRWFTIDVQKNS